MAGRLGAQAEVAGRRDQARAEVVEPEAVHQHAGGERVVRAGDGAGQFEPSAAVREGLALRAGEDLQELARDGVALVLRVAAQEDARVLLRLAVGDDEGVRGRDGRADEVAVHFALEPPEFLRVLEGEEQFSVHDAVVRDDGG